MSLFSVPTWLNLVQIARSPNQHPGLHALAQISPDRLPKFVQDSEAAMKYLRLLSLLDWDRFPDRPDQRFSLNCPPLPYAPFVAAYLVKIDRRMPYVADLHAYLVENPALVWVLGFPLVRSSAHSWGFNVGASLPTHRHLSRLLRTIPNACLQFLLDETLRLIRAELQSELAEGCRFGDCVSVDTKHVIAWVKENNPKAYVTDRYDKTRQPRGDPDCRLGCKRKHNKGQKGQTVESMPTPLKNPVPANHLEIGEFYWGYGSGVVATKVADWGEFVLAELTQPFDQPDVSYFHPLMAQVERRLGHKPCFGAFDAAFDALCARSRALRSSHRECQELTT